MIEQSSIEQMWAAENWPALMDEYHTEAAVEGMPPPGAKMATYKNLEQHGLQTFVATHNGKLVGFILVMIPTMPHYDRPIAFAESFFVSKAHRMTGAGLRLLSMAEAVAEVAGSPGLLVTCPFASRLMELLPDLGYREVSRIFFKPGAAA
jgi:GNAT superfamily N-acetyltransferase